MSVVTIFNVGSINVDHLYLVERLPEPGETLSARSSMINLGGKGLNASVALSRSGADVRHIGLIGSGDTETRAMIKDLGLAHDLIFDADAPTGHAIIYLDDCSENCIVILGGANLGFTEDLIRTALRDAREGDWLVLQNETNANEMAIKIAREKEMKIALVAAPFDTKTMPGQAGLVDLVSMNETEAELFEAATGVPISEAEGPAFLITYGKKGAMFLSGTVEQFIGAHDVNEVDTTGAGDTFFGAFLTHYVNGAEIDICLAYASAAAALMVRRTGAATVIPVKREVEEFLRQQCN